MSIFRKSISATEVSLGVETKGEDQSRSYTMSYNTYNPASNPFYPSLDTAYTDGARGFADGAVGYTPAPMAGINTIITAKSKLRER